ncbi:MAG: hypothetical protein EA363_11835 [Balneolaceae bacterium]|nr:MAG: hypothetical protein EA363_11835 [Balneolaceae bacterium]
MFIEKGQKLPKTLDHCPLPYGREWIVEHDRFIIRNHDQNGYVIEYLITNRGSHITVNQNWPVWEDSVFGLVNMVMGAALTIQGRSMLHACSLVDDGRSFLIMGESGAGKSSLSVALAAEGLAAHSDDIAVIHNLDFGDKSKNPGPHPTDQTGTSPTGEPGPHPPASTIKSSGPHPPRSTETSTSPQPVITGTHPVIAPGYPRIKVKPELLDTLGITGVTPIRIASVESPEGERWLDTDQLAGGTYRSPAPLGAIFLLRERSGKADAPQVRRLDPMPAAVALSSHIYGTAWFNPPGPRNLFLCTYIAGRVPVYEVTLPDDLGRIRASARHLLDHYIRN